MVGVPGRPKVAVQELPALVERFGISAVGLEWKELPSYDDVNFWIRVEGKCEYVLKVHNGLSPSGTPERLEAQNRLMARLAEYGLPVPRVVEGPSGARTIAVELQEACEGKPHARLLTYLAGEVLPNDTRKDAAFLERIGDMVGRVSMACEGFEDAAAHWTWEWDMKLVPETVRGKLDAIENPERRALVARFADEYATALSPDVLASLPHSVIHADLNDTNLLYSGEEVVGIIDFGDSIYTCTIFEPAIAAGYYSLGQKDPLMVFCHVLKGYRRTVTAPLSGAELRAFFHGARGRVLLSVAMAMENKRLEPDNEYLAHTAEPGWAVLENLAHVSEAAAVDQLQAAVDHVGSCKG